MLLKDIQRVRVYTKALFEIACEHEVVTPVYMALQCLSPSSALLKELLSLNLTRGCILDILESVVVYLPKKSILYMRVFLNLLAKEHQLHLIAPIEKQFLKQRAESEEGAFFICTTPYMYEASQKKQIYAKLKKIFENVQIQWEIDPKLHAGLTLQYLDFQIDLSAKRLIEQLQESFATLYPTSTL